LLFPQPCGLKPVVDFCCVARSSETAAGIALRSCLQKSATVFQRPSWDFISGSLTKQARGARDFEHFHHSDAVSGSWEIFMEHPFHNHLPSIRELRIKPDFS
jgi:hypothetical protein